MNHQLKTQLYVTVLIFVEVRQFYIKFVFVFAEDPLIRVGFQKLSLNSDCIAYKLISVCIEEANINLPIDKISPWDLALIWQRHTDSLTKGNFEN